MTTAPALTSPRHLAAVWFADIAGYTRLASEDEDRALGLVSLFQPAVRDSVTRFEGRVVKFLGDGALAEFGSTEAAARAALEVCRSFAERSSEAGTPSALRIGLHLGEVATDPAGDVYGDGVNVASRLQAEAKPGQVVASEDAWRLLRRRQGFRLEDLGHRRLKGIADPVRVYAIAPATESPPGAKTAVPGVGVTRLLHGVARRPVLRWVVPAALLAAAAGWWLLGSASRDEPDPGSGGARTIAVLPFESIGGDPEGEYLSEGVAMDIITGLSRIGGLRVISRTSSMQYKDTDKTLRQIGEELGAQSVLEGTIQRAGNRIRISVRLVDAASDEDRWAATYDREIRDIFAIQSEVAAQVAEALEATLNEADRARLAATPTENLAAYRSYLRGRSHLARHTERDTRTAIEALESALALDSGYARAHAGIAMASAEMHLRFAPRAEVAAWGERAVAEARRALELDPDLAEAHEALAAVYRKTDFDWHQTISESRRALELDPSLAAPHYYIAASYYHLGLLDHAEREVRDGMSIDPAGDRIEPLRTLGIIALLRGRFTDAVAALEEVRELSEQRISDSYLAQALYYAGDSAGAESMLQELGHSSSASAATRASATLASFLAAGGERAEAEKIADSVAQGAYMDHHVAYGLGAAYAQLARPGDAVRWLREAADTGFPCHPWFALDPLLTPIRGDPEFRDFATGLEATWEAERTRYGAS